MILVVGLGNPGERYADTRHNLGFLVVDRLAAKQNGVFRSRFSAEICQVDVGSERLLLLKPQTYVNRSGDSVQPAAHFYRVDPADILVVHDELDLPFGQVRLKQGGGEAGHNGLRSISERLGSSAYVRLRLGIGRPGANFRGDGAAYVLDGFSSSELATLSEVVERAAGAVEMVAERGLSVAMNEINRRPR